MGGLRGLVPTSHAGLVHRSPSLAKLQRLPSLRRGGSDATDLPSENINKTTPLANQEGSDTFSSHLMLSDDGEHPFSSSDYLATAITPYYPFSYFDHQPLDRSCLWMMVKLEKKKQALAASVSKSDVLGLGRRDSPLSILVSSPPIPFNSNRL